MDLGKKQVIGFTVFLIIELTIWVSVHIIAGDVAGKLTAYVISVINIMIAAYFVLKSMK